MNTKGIRPAPPAEERHDYQLELLRRFYEDVGLDSRVAEQAALADLDSLYASAWTCGEGLRACA